MSTLSIAVVLALATDPQCGAARPGAFAERLVAIAGRESGRDPLAIGIDPDPAHGLPASSVRASTPAEAAAYARTLIAQGRHIGLGLMQISDAQLARHGLTIENAFDACRNMRAGADHYRADVQAVLNLAARRYNTGSIERGAAYAAGIERELAIVRRVVDVPGDVAVPQPRPAPQPSPPSDLIPTGAGSERDPAPPPGWHLMSIRPGQGSDDLIQTGAGSQRDPAPPHTPSPSEPQAPGVPHRGPENQQ